MKQLSISLLTAFLAEILKEHEGFEYQIQPIDDYNKHWNFEVLLIDKLDNELTLELKFKVDYLDKSIWIECGEDWWEKVESDRWTCKYFWYRMYCKK